MLRSTTIAGLVTVLAVSFVLGQDTPSNPDVVPYKWSTLISIPVVPSGYSEFLNWQYCATTVAPCDYSTARFEPANSIWRLGSHLSVPIYLRPV